VRSSWYLVLAGIAGIVFWLRRYLQTEKGRYARDFYLLKAPVIGEFYLKVSVARFTRTLSAMIESGVPILEALRVTEKTVNNLVIAHVIRNIQMSITEGQSLTEPFRASGIFPQMVVQMISLGEESGKLEQMLLEVAAYYDRETEYTIKNVTVVIEPILLLVVGGIVAFIALSVLMPIFNLIKVFRRGI
jgi:type II secretory pathway component PulF